MALTLSNSGISSGSVIRAAEISQSIDAFTGAEAYNITLSGSFTMKGDQQVTSDPGGTGSLTVVGIQAISASLSHGVGLVLTGSMTQAQGEIKMDKLIVSSSENILGVFDSTDDAAKIVLKDANGEGARFSYVGSEDTIGIGQSNIHNSMSIHIDNDENVAIGALHFTPNAVLDVSGSFLVSGSSFMSGSITASGDISSSATVSMLTASIGGGIFTSASLAAGGGGGGGTPAGSDGQIQFNNAGAFGAQANFSFNSTTGLFSSPHGTFSTMSLSGGNYKMYEVTSENIQFNPDDNAYYTKIKGYDGNGDFEVGDGELTYRGDRVRISGSAGASILDVSGSIKVGDANNIQINGNEIYSNISGPMVIGNQSSAATSGLTLVVGGAGGGFGAMNINVNQEISFGNPTSSFDYPLGFKKAEIASYAQFQNKNAVSSSVVAIKGNDANSDGILYVGGNASSGGGIVYKGDATSPFGELGQLNAGNVELYRSDPATEIAYPMLSFPPSVNRINLTSGTTSNTIADPEFIQISSVPGLTNNNNDNNYRRVYPVVASTIVSGGSKFVIELPASNIGIYSITSCFFGCQQGTVATSFSREDKLVYYNDAGAGSTPTQQGATKNLLNVQAAGLNNAFSSTGDTDVIKLQINNNQAGITIEFAGYVTVDFLKIVP